MELRNLQLWMPRLEPLLIDEVTADSRAVRGKRTLFVALKGRHGDGHAYVPEAIRAGAACALVCNEYQAPEEVLEERLIRVEDPLAALQDLAGWYRSTLPSLQVVAVTGSCGKTMLKDLLGHLFFGPEVFTSPESFNSQFGVALSLLSIPQGAHLAFIEMAANRPGEMERLVQIGRAHV